MKNRILLPCIVAAITAMISIAGLFLPYIGSTPEYADYLNSVSNQKPFDTADITAATSVDLSLYEYAKTYWQGSDEIFGNKAVGVFYTIIFVSPGIFGFFALLCALRKKGIPIILQSLIIGGSSYLISWDVVDRGIMPNYGRVWGISHVLYYPVAGILLICGVWIFIVKRKMKKINRTAE